MANSLSVKDKAFLVIIFFYIAYTIFPLFSDLTGIPIYVPSLFLIVALLWMYYQAFMRVPTQWFLAYIVVLILYIIFGKQLYINGLDQSLSPLYRVVIESAWLLPSVTIMNVLLYKNDMRLYRIVGYGSLILLIISFLYVLPMVVTYSNYLREDFESLGYERPLGLPDYTLMHAYTLMLLPLCLLLKKTIGRMRYVSIILLLLFSYMITQTAVFTSIVVMLMSFFFAYLFDVKRLGRSVLVLGVVFFIGYVLYQYGFFLMIVDGLMPYFEGTAVASKLEDLHTSMIRGEIIGGTMTTRMSVHQLSKEAFWNNPIVGSDIVHIGHSKILDMLGAMGLLAFIPYIMILYSGLKGFVIRVKDKELKAYLYFSFILSGIYLYTKGLFGSPGYLFTLVIVPSIIMAINKGVSYRKR